MNYGLYNTELDGLAEVGGSSLWAALYANKGSATYAGYINGNTWINGLNYTSSDRSLKENLREIDNSLDKVLRLKGQKYDRKYDKSMYKDLPILIQDINEKQYKDNLGFIAQDVEKILPEAVFFDEASKKYGINYDAIIPVLVEAIKEQQKQIEDLQSCCTKNFLKSANKATNLEENAPIEGAELFQNKPNPFTKDTEIAFILPDIVENAFLGVYT